MKTLRLLPVAVALVLFGCDDSTTAPKKTAEAKPASTADKKPEEPKKDDPAPAAEDEPDAEPDAEGEDEPEAALDGENEPEGEGEDDPEAAEREAKVASALEIAAEIEAKPEDLEAILGAHDMTQAQFSALLYEIAEDPELAVMYAEGREEEPEQG